MIQITKKHFLMDSKPVEASEILRVMNNYVQIDEDVTLLDLFRIVDQYKILKVVVSQYATCDAIEEFHAQIKEPMRSEDELDYLEVYWRAKVQKDGFLNIVSYLHGFKGQEHYSVSYCPVWELADTPIKINTKLKVLGKKSILLECEKQFTLLEFLTTIYDDISFVGGPQEKQEFLGFMGIRMHEAERLWAENEQDN